MHSVLSGSEKLSVVFWLKAPFVFLIVMMVSHFSITILNGIDPESQLALAIYMAGWALGLLASGLMIWMNSKNTGRVAWTYLARLVVVMQAAYFVYVLSRI